MHRTAALAAMMLSQAALCESHIVGDGQEAIELDEIVVTATKRQVPLADVPMSVAVVSGESLQQVGASSIDDVWRYVPNLAVRDAPFGGRSYIIRGFADSDSFQSTEAITAVYMDDTPVTHVPGLFNTPADLAMLDMARLEVLRGPQGALVGANAMGGAVRMISAEPDTASPSFSAESNLSQTDHGGFNTGARLTWNLPTGTYSAVRVAALHQSDDGFIDDIGLGREDINGQDRTAGRFSWGWSPSGGFDVLARLYHEAVETHGYNYADDVGRPWAGLPTDDEYEVVLYSPEQRDEEIELLSLRLRWNLAGGELYSATSWYNKDLYQALDWSVEQYLFSGEFFSLNSGLDAPTISDNYSTQTDRVQELRFSRNHDWGDWLAGIYFLDQDYALNEYLAAENIPAPLSLFGQEVAGVGDNFVYVRADTSGRRKDIAFFADVSWKLRDRLDAGVGFRWYSSEREQAVGGSGLFVVPGTADAKSDGMVPRATLSWHASDRTMVYGLFSTGFRPGQFNPAGAVGFCGAPPAIDDDEVTNLELGFRHRSLARNLAVSASLFHTDWRDMQFTALEAADCGFPVLGNAAEASSRGMELAFMWWPTSRLELGGGLGYNDAQLDSEVTTAALNIPAGTPIPNVPKWTGNVSATWSFDWPRGTPGYLRAAAQFVDERRTLFDPNSFPTYPEMDAYTLVNLRVGAERPRWTAEFFATNVFNERAQLFCCRNFFDPAVNRPRTMGARLIWRVD